ncbi:MAG: glycosyltransferase family 2 protein [Chlorobiaceae bacterium]|nr:glycosyltransferase family 2 protein [Chlorobiaceae bacterium]
MIQIAELIVRLLIVVLSLPAAYLLVVTLAAYLFRKKATETNRLLSIGVLIPAHNEEEGIVRTIESIRTGNYPKELTSIFVIADNCTDRTAEMARNAGAIVAERTDIVNRGKGQALDWFLRTQSRSYQHVEVITIIDADVQADRNYLREISLSFSQKGVEALQAFNGVNNPGAGWRPGLLDAAFNVFNHLRMAGPSTLSGTCVLKGNGMAFSRSLLETTGWPCHSIVEDMEFSLQLLRQKIAVHYNPDAVVRSDMVTTSKNASSQRNRWESGRFKLVRTTAMPLLGLFLRTGQSRFLVAFAELVTPPLSLLALLFALVSLMAIPLLKGYWLACVASWWLILVFYVLSGQIQRKAPPSTWLVLMAAPFYVLWKIPLYAAMMIRKKSGAWIRTARENTPPER